MFSTRPSRSHLRRKQSIWHAALTVAVLWVGVHSQHAYGSAAPSVSSDHAPSKLEKQVQVWVSRLAEQKPFRHWPAADSQIEALGPGTHGWLVLFTKEGKHIGYMVVHAVTDGTFQLGEYGLGPFPLFSQQLLVRSLIDGGLATETQLRSITAVKHYVHPFAAAWEVKVGGETYWLDAKTAEQLPVNVDSWKKMFPGDLNLATDADNPEESGIEALQLNETFDVYEKLPWLTQEAPFPAKNAKLLQQRLDGANHLRYVTEPFGDAMLYAVSIIGYQRWSNGRLDVAMDMEGTRFVPIEALLNKGLFYR
ncbi:hypothetical protein [Cohnella terricola]|uniref:Uncharacterized protein n=1 Tax=Cohnella terricola TaxID=1289167 RepID=A0A559JWS6_9BACL|nr:hypothetical protein [Cohnella terricola]TVY04342.1 hypothetical protein FPZ45_01760 [Cohnella terricola]